MRGGDTYVSAITQLLCRTKSVGSTQPVIDEVREDIEVRGLSERARWRERTGGWDRKKKERPVVRHIYIFYGAFSLRRDNYPVETGVCVYTTRKSMGIYSCVQHRTK